MSTQCVSLEKQGMLSILGSDCDERTSSNKAVAAASIRRTLSADMSSNKWLIASSELEEVVESDSSNSSEDEKHHQPKTFDGWSSILSKTSSHNNNENSSSNNLPPPYIHPLVKRSNTCLSKKSLEICTESLGSETGSDCFSSSPSSENEQQQQQQQQQQHSSVAEPFEDFHVVKYSNTKRLSSPRSFPPPLPSVHMQSRRQDGRLILEAVPAPPKDYLHAQRIDGRLLLTYIDQSDHESELEIMENHGGEVEEFEQVFDDIQEVGDHETPLLDNDGDDEDESEEEEVEEEEEEEKADVERKGMGIVMEQSPRLSSEVIVTFENSTLVPHRFNSSVNSVNMMIGNTVIRESYTCPSFIPQSLPSPRRVAQVIPAPPPPPPPPAGAASFNAYEYFWRKKPVVNNPIIDDKCNKNNYYSNKQVVLTQANGTDPKAVSTTSNAGYEQQDLVVTRGNKASTNNLVPYLRSCKEPRRPLIIREPYCIATS